jgi:hypothetical protein
MNAAQSGNIGKSWATKISLGFCNTFAKREREKQGLIE